MKEEIEKFESWQADFLNASQGGRLNGAWPTGTWFQNRLKEVRLKKVLDTKNDME